MNEAAQMPLSITPKGDTINTADVEINDMETITVESIDIRDNSFQDNVINCDSKNVQSLVEDNDTVIYNENETNRCNIDLDNDTSNNDEYENEECENLIPIESNKYELKDISIETIISKFRRNRRSDTMKSLQYEDFTSCETDKKQAGFYTDSPLLWFNAIREYTILNEIVNRCELKRNKNNQVTICKIHLCFNTTKQVMLSINCVTGVIFLKGIATNEWIETEFSKVREFILKPIQERHENDDKETPSKNENKEETETTVMEKSENEIQIENLWAITETLKTSIQNIGSSITGVSDWVKNLEAARVEQFVTIEKKLNELELRLDAKINLLTDEQDNMIVEELKKVRITYDLKYSNVKTEVGNIKNELQRQIFEILEKPAETLNLLKTKINNIESELIKIKTIDTSDSHTMFGGTDNNQYSEVSMKLENISKQFIQQEKLITELQKNINSYKVDIEINSTIDDTSVSEQEQGEVPTDEMTKFIMCFDSNRHFVDFRKLWTLKGTKVKPCGNWKEVDKVINNTNYTNLEYFFTNVGCNDLDVRKGDELFNCIKNTIENLKKKYPNIKVIISEITPRMDKLDAAVKATNTLISQYVDKTENTYIAKHGNLRDRDFYYDQKHLKESIIPRFAANIKRGINTAYGREYKKRTWYHANSQESNYQHNSGHNSSSDHNYDNNYNYSWL